MLHFDCFVNFLLSHNSFGSNFINCKCHEQDIVFEDMNVREGESVTKKKNIDLCVWVVWFLGCVVFGYFRCIKFTYILHIVIHAGQMKSGPKK